MAQVDNHGEAVQTDEATLLKKRARRRLIGAAALALFAAIVLPMVMDHQPAPALKDIQVRIPSPDEGVTQRVAPKSAPRITAKSIEPDGKPVDKADIKPIAKPEPKSENKPEAKPEAKEEPKSEPKVEPRIQPQPEPAAESAASGSESWEIQLGAYQEPGRVKNLLAKLKGVGVPTYTEKVETPNGPRTRVRAGPFPSQEVAEKARARVKIVGVDGPVAKKP